MLRLAVLLSLTLAVAACKRDPNAAPPCGAVGAKFLVIARGELDATLGSGDRGEAIETTRRAALDQVPAMRDSLVNACSDKQWGEGVRRCLVEAQTHVAFEACQQQLTADQRQHLERLLRGETK